MSLRTYLGLALLAIPGAALADGFLSVEAPAALPISSMQEGAFKAGVMPAVGLYADNGWLAGGLRLRAGILRNGPAPGAGISDPGTGGLMTLSLAMRVHHKGLWAELAGGGGITGGDAVPAVEVGVGFDFAVGDFAIGPAVRFVDVIERDQMSTLGSASLALVGVDVQWGGHKAAKPRRIAAVAIQEHPAVVETERDWDRVIDRDVSCAEKLDGCPISKHLNIVNDRIVLDERVLFDVDQARVKDEGRELIAEVAAAWLAHPEWKRITVEGHCDERGSDSYNQLLSERRALHARELLILAGFQEERIDAIGYGRTRPRDAGKTEAAMQRNRRVEFVIDREVSK